MVKVLVQHGKYIRKFPIVEKMTFKTSCPRLGDDCFQNRNKPKPFPVINRERACRWGVYWSRYFWDIKLINKNYGVYPLLIIALGLGIVGESIHNIKTMFTRDDVRYFTFQKFPFQKFDFNNPTKRKTLIFFQRYPPNPELAKLHTELWAAQEAAKREALEAAMNPPPPEEGAEGEGGEGGEGAPEGAAPAPEPAPAK